LHMSVMEADSVANIRRACSMRASMRIWRGVSPNTALNVRMK
jgi:hypothetical protein